MPRNFDTVLTRDFSEFEGEVRWAGPLLVGQDSESLGTDILHAALQCDPVFTEWPPGEVVHLHGAEIVPSSVYQVEAVRIGCADTLDDPSLFGGPEMAIFTIDMQSFHQIPEGVPSFERTPG